MNITFCGATRTVTGSCFLVETKRSKFLVDCGMFQGGMTETMLNLEPFPFNPGSIDFVPLTHAHIDHTGRIPKLYLDGFSGEIIATDATADLCSIMLPDSGHIQEMEIEWINRKRQRMGKHSVPPMYTAQDAIDCMKLFRGVGYNKVIQITDEIKVKFNDAGHMLGSSIIEVWVNEDGVEKKVVFTGDLGNKNLPILRDATYIKESDYLVIESTYGSRIHSRQDDKAEMFLDIIVETIDKGGNVIIPSFAVGRTQEMLYELHRNKDKYGDKLKKLMSVPVFVDSPLAISATEIFKRHLKYYDEEAQEFISKGENPLEFEGLKFARSATESKMLNEIAEPCIIISASGMCEVGRIKHHLKHNLWRQESTILFVGYQAPGTLGRRIVDGEKRVKIFGEDVSVNARIEYIDSFSGHADRDGLLNWIKHMEIKPKNIFIVHGEYEGQQIFSGLIKALFNVSTVIPEKGEVYELGETCNKLGEIVNEEPRHSKLGILQKLENLKEVINEITNVIRKDLKTMDNDENVSLTQQKLEALEKMIAGIIK